MGDRLRLERQRGFVGREAELALFGRLLVDPSHSLLFVWGQVGVGKSALLHELLRVALGSGHQAHLVDARQLGGEADASKHGVRDKLLYGLAAGAPLDSDRRRVLLVDGFERTVDYEWLSDLASEVGSDVLLVCASRSPPPAALLVDSAWSSLILQCELTPLGRPEATALLELRGVPQRAQAEILQWAAGYPLALALAASALASAQEETFALELLHDVQHQLLQVLFPAPFSLAQQLAVEACCLARELTADLLEQVCRTTALDQQGESGAAFSWLSLQPFIEWTPQGIRPHALVRMALEARLRRERPRRYRALLQALREAAIVELSSGDDTGTALSTLFFLDREVPRVRRWFPGLERSLQSLQLAEMEERPQILELLRTAEGPESAALLARWQGIDGGSLEVVRGEGVEAFLQCTRLDPRSAARTLPTHDPAADIARRYMSEHPLQSGEASLIFRWVLDREHYQTPSSRVLALIGRLSQIVLSTPNLPYSFCVFRKPSDWTTSWGEIALPWRSAGRFTVGAHEYTLIVFEWKRRALRDVLAQPGPRQEQALPVQDPGSYDELRLKVGERVTKLARKANLTPRELEILEQLCLGHSVDEVARNLSIRPRTVKFHQENLLRKTGASSRVELFRKLL